MFPFQILFFLISKIARLFTKQAHETGMAGARDGRALGRDGERVDRAAGGDGAVRVGAHDGISKVVSRIAHSPTTPPFSRVSMWLLMNPACTE